MSIEIKNINKIMKKLDNISNIDTSQLVKESSVELRDVIRKYAMSFSKDEWEYISNNNIEKTKTGCYAAVGLKNDFADWELWKGLYFHNFGYRQNVYGYDTGKMTTMHILWFDDAVKSSAEYIQSKLKEKLKEEIKKAKEG